MDSITIVPERSNSNAKPITVIVDVSAFLNACLNVTTLLGKPLDLAVLT